MSLVWMLLPFVALIIALTIGVIVVFHRQGMFRPQPPAWPFYVKRPLSTPEQILYHRLVRALPNHIVLAQVQASRVLGVLTGYDFKQWNQRVDRLSYDFVVCSKDAKVVAAIELDDAAPDEPARLFAEAKKDKASAAAGLRLLRWSAHALPDDATIRSLFAPEAPRTLSRA
jgi:hypothetical protein